MQDTILESDSDSDSNIASCILVNSRFSYEQIKNVDLCTPPINQIWSKHEEDILLGLKNKRIYHKQNSKNSSLNYEALAIYYRDTAKQFMLENPSATDIYLRTRDQIENKIKRLKKSTNLDRKW